MFRERGWGASAEHRSPLRGCQLHALLALPSYLGLPPPLANASTHEAQGVCRGSAARVRALCAVLDGFERWLLDHSEPGYHVFSGRANLSVDDLDLPAGTREGEHLAVYVYNPAVCENGSLNFDISTTDAEGAGPTQVSVEADNCQAVCKFGCPSMQTGHVTRLVSRDDNYLVELRIEFGGRGVAE